MDPDREVYYGDYGCDSGTGSSSYEPDYAEDDVSEYHGHEWGVDSMDELDEDAVFEKMWPTVEVMCRSLMYEPADWVQDSYTLTHKPTKMVYWTGSGTCNPIVESYIGSDSARIFSEKQGTLLRDAWNRRHHIVPNSAQLRAMKAFGTDPKPFVPEPGFWGQLWVAIKFFPIMVRFCMSVKK